MWPFGGFCNNGLWNPMGYPPPTPYGRFGNPSPPVAPGLVQQAVDGTYSNTITPTGLTSIGVGAITSNTIETSSITTTGAATLAVLSVSGTAAIGGNTSITGTLTVAGAPVLSYLTANGVVTTTGGNGTLTITTATGSGNIVYSTSPTLITPALGVATCTSINGLTIPTTTGEFALTSGKTFSVSSTMTLNGTDGASLIIGGGGTLGTAAYTASSAYFPATATTGTGSVVLAASPTLTGVAFAENINATGYIYAQGFILCSDPSNGIGYATGAGGTVTQVTSKATSVTLSRPTGLITMNNAALAAGAIVSFTLSNTCITSTDQLVVSHVSGGTLGAYDVTYSPGTSQAVIYVSNRTSGSLSEAIVLAYSLVKSVTS